MRDALRSIAPSKAVDLVFAGSALVWAGRHLVRGFGGEGQPAMDLAVALLDLAVAALFLRRRPVSDPGASGGLVVAGLTVLAAGAALSLIPGPHPVWAQALFVLGALGTAASLLRLGRSFAVLPARRPVVAFGPYRIVRHPAYACELLMMAGALAPGGVRAWVAGAVVTGLQVARLLVEERALGDDPEYAVYRARVRHRLVPFVF